MPGFAYDEGRLRRRRFLRQKPSVIRRGEKGKGGCPKFGVEDPQVAFQSHLKNGKSHVVSRRAVELYQEDAPDRYRPGRDLGKKRERAALVPVRQYQARVSLTFKYCEKPSDGVLNREG